MSEKVVVTRQGYEKMLESLKFLKTTKRREVADQLEKARAFGDLSENAEYETAKEAKNQLETRIRELEERVAHAKVVELDDIPK
ncbi:MAG TPA: transcription elongation factor GreA, partial [Candidatus Omnitrophota bacterium]|nr:transcription elongation factor GreA [Candidatus Omnitrophota bacterium]